MHDSNEFGCHKVGGQEPRVGAVRPVEELPEMGTWLLARLRFWVVCSLLPPEQGASS